MLGKFYEREIVEKKGIVQILSLLNHNQISAKVVKRCLSLLWVLTRGKRTQLKTKNEIKI